MGRIDGLILTFVLNALWQIPAAVAAGLLGDRLLRRASASLRHVLWLAVFSACLLFPAVSLRRALPSPDPMAAPSHAPLAARAGDVRGWLPFGEDRPAPVVPAGAAGVVAWLWGLSILAHGAVLIHAWRRACGLARGAHPLAIPEGLAPAVSRCRSALGVRDAEILGSAETAGPLTVGALRPLILLPSRFFDHASPEETVSALGHELAHVRRRDYAINLLCELLLLPIALHPAVRVVRRRLAITREMACDEAALESLVSHRVYARSLLSLAAAVAGIPRPSTTLGVLDAQTLEVRMKRILDNRPKMGARRARAALGAVLLLLAGIGAAAAVFSVEAVAASPSSNASAGQGDLKPFVGTWSGDWAADKHNAKKMRALDVEVRPDGRIVETWYKYQITPDGAVNPRKMVHPVAGYTVAGNTLRLKVRVESFAFRDEPAAPADIEESLELRGAGDAVFRSLSNSYVEAAKKRGEPVPPPPPPIQMKRLP
ncbi:MAG TPA: M56 family metallopeptidase [Thermoanaerobaculia bacterium]|nr:M56 family metallopeptidase [Thermoanaerobaculia bacterium]